MRCVAPHTAGRHAAKRFRKAACCGASCVLAHDAPQRGQEAQGVRIVKHAFDLINLMTKKNRFRSTLTPSNAGPRELYAYRLGRCRAPTGRGCALRRVNVAIHDGHGRPQLVVPLA